MNYLRYQYCLIIFFLCCFSVNYSVAQKRNYTVDSLQIKVYTEIEYTNSQPKDILVKKVFCDYCTNNQIKYIGEKAKELAFYDRYNPKKRIVNGIRKFAIIIRVSKKDFLAIRDE
jgi:hypothetical protein